MAHVEVLHAVEQQVLEYYPDLFTWQQIESIENLRGLPTPTETDNAVRIAIRMMWDEAYAAIDALGRPPMQQDFLDVATAIDDRFGVYFVPAERQEAKREYYWLAPEVDALLVHPERHNATDRGRRLPAISIELRGWSGAAIIAARRHYFCLREVADLVRASGLTGATFQPVEVTKAEDWAIDQPSLTPCLTWLELLPTGTLRADDFAISAQGSLLVSQQALDLLKRLDFGYANTYPESFHPDGPPAIGLHLLREGQMYRESHRQPGE